MARKKQRAPPPPIDLPPDGQTTTRRSITVAFYWPMEGYGCHTKFESADAAFAYARRQAPDAEDTGRAVVHVVETVQTVTVVRVKE